MSQPATGGPGLFGGPFDNGVTRTGDGAWLKAMLDTEAALERADLAASGRAPPLPAPRLPAGSKRPG